MTRFEGSLGSPLTGRVTTRRSFGAIRADPGRLWQLLPARRGLVVGLGRVQAPADAPEDGRVHREPRRGGEAPAGSFPRRFHGSPGPPGVVVHRLTEARGHEPLTSISCRAVPLAISGSGALSSLETTVLLTVDETMDALRKAGPVGYTVPGA